MKKLIVTLISVAALAGSVGAQEKSKPASASAQNTNATAASERVANPTDVVARVNGVEIRRKELDDAEQALLTQLQQRGIRVTIMSGDALDAVAFHAKQLGVDDWHAGLSPQQKLDALQELQAAGEVVAMVGDGINDGPVLAGAQVSITWRRQSSANLASRGTGWALAGITAPHPPRPAVLSD